MQQQWDVLVIGAGPAGLSAASAAAENGLEVILLDEQEMPGGQIYRNVGAKNARKNFLSKEDREEGLSMVVRFLAGGAVYSPKTTVWFAEPGRVICSREGKSSTIKAQVIILATGAMERPVPFSGWTLPGVMGAGAADILYKNSGVLPEGPVVLAGNGPLIPLVGSHLAAKGVTVSAVLNTAPLSNHVTSLIHMPPALRDIPFLLKGVMLLKDLMTSGAKMVRGVNRIAAHGENCLSRVSYDAGGKTETVEAATLLFHEGVIPRTHVSRMLKLDHAWNSTQRHWYPVCDASGRSSRDNIYVVGDGASVHGAAASALKGEIAGIDAAAKLRVISPEEARDKSGRAKARLGKALAPRGFVDAFFAPGKNLFDVENDVLVCRCEGVTAGDIRRAVAEGCRNVNEIKIRTRCGMGPCQGRMCGPALGEIAALALETAPYTLGALNIRPPVRPIPLREICEFEQNSPCP